MRIIPFALLCATMLAAAPVPRDRPAADFPGILTAEDLKAVTFRSTPARSAEELKALKLKPGERLEDYDVAVHLPRTRIPHGDPIPAYFVVKSCTKDKVGLKMLVDFTDASAGLRGDTAFALRCLTPGVEAEMLQQRITHCSDSPLAVIPAGGYWVSRGDMNRLGSKPLPPGDYQLEWRCQSRNAAPVKFTVTPDGTPAERPKAKPLRHRFFAIQPDDAEAGHDDLFTWNEFTLEPIHAEQMAAALAVGPFGKFVPDVRRLPSADERLTVRASLRREKDVEKLIVTLESKDPRTPVEFEDVPSVYLHIEESVADEPREQHERSARDQVKRANPVFKTPLTIEVPFDSERWKEAGFRDGRVSAIVTSGKMTFPSRGHEQARLQRVLDIRSVGRDSSKMWSGIVRSESLPLNPR
ncbi:MAG: hypothetical protein U0791_16815 [Gemmataceae bacterium]